MIASFEIHLDESQRDEADHSSLREDILCPNLRRLSLVSDLETQTRRRTLNDVSVKIATWNINSLSARWPRVQEWITPTSLDTVLLQEITRPTSR